MDPADIILKSCCVMMRDGIRIAVSVWLPREAGSVDPRPAVLMTTLSWPNILIRFAAREYDALIRMPLVVVMQTAQYRARDELLGGLASHKGWHGIAYPMPWCGRAWLK